MKLQSELLLSLYSDKRLPWIILDIETPLTKQLTMSTAKQIICQWRNYNKHVINYFFKHHQHCRQISKTIVQKTQLKIGKSFKTTKWLTRNWNNWTSNFLKIYITNRSWIINDETVSNQQKLKWHTRETFKIF